MSELAADSKIEADRGDRQWLLITVLTIIYLCGFVDRSIISLLIDPIKADLRLSDVELSIIAGLAFTVAQTGMNLPAGFLIDRYSRRGVIGVAGFGWSFVTMITAFAGNFWQLFLGRFAVGIGESFIVPCTYSLIRDRVSGRGQGWAFTCLAMALAGGTSIAFLGGAALLDAADAGRLNGFPIIGGMANWQKVLAIVGLLSMPVALLALIIKPDPRRGTVGGVHKSTGTEIREGWDYLRSNLGFYMFLVGGSLAGNFQVYNTRTWAASMLSRKFDLPISHVGYTIGVVSLVASLSGLFICGVVVDRIAVKRANLFGFWKIWLIGGQVAAILVGTALSPAAAWATLAVHHFLAGSGYVIGGVILSRATPSNMMGKMTSIYLLIPGLLGALGPTVLALIAGSVFQGPAAISNAYAVCSFAMLVFGLITVFGLERTYHTKVTRDAAAAASLASAVEA